MIKTSTNLATTVAEAHSCNIDIHRHWNCLGKL